MKQDQEEAGQDSRERASGKGKDATTRARCVPPKSQCQGRVKCLVTVMSMGREPIRNHGKW